jgi:hypothetical protein
MKPLLLLASLAFSTSALAGLLVTDVAGKAEIEGKGPIATLAEIPDGASLSLAPNAQLVAVDLVSGREYMLKGNARYIITAAGPKTADGKPVDAKPLPAKNLPEVKVATGKVAQATLVMRSIRKFNVPVLHAPARTTVVTLHPTFQWGNVEGASNYRMLLKAQEGGTPWETTVTANELTPGQDRALSPGVRYTWRIEALGADGRTISDASASFSVAPAEVIKRLEDLRPAADAPFGRRVLYASQLREAGAIADAQALWKILARERPDDEVLKALAE